MDAIGAPRRKLQLLQPLLAVVVILSSLTTPLNACIPTKIPTPGMPALPACKKCAESLVSVDPNGVDFDSTNTVSSGACAVKTFVCTGTLVGYNGGGSTYTTVDADGKLRFVLTCSADGSKWLAADGAPVAGSVGCFG